MEETGATQQPEMALVAEDAVRQRHMELFAQAVREQKPRYGYLSLSLLSDVELYGIALRAGIKAGFFVNPKWAFEGVDDAPYSDVQKWGKLAWDLYQAMNRIDPN